MKTIENVQIGDYVELCDTDLMIKNFLSDNMFRGMSLIVLRDLCSLQEKKKYKVMDVCKTCKTLRVKVRKKSPAIRYKYIKSVY